jgi:hypothetical protein
MTTEFWAYTLRDALLCLLVLAGVRFVILEAIARWMATKQQFLQELTGSPKPSQKEN